MPLAAEDDARLADGARALIETEPDEEVRASLCVFASAWTQLAGDSTLREDQVDEQGVA